jgi:DNA repair ATPase RecN
METQKSELDESKAAAKEVSAAGETTNGALKATPASPKPASSDPSSSTPQGAKSIFHAAPLPKLAEATPKASHSLEDAIKEVSKIVTSGKVTQADVPAIKAILTEHANLKGKVDKVKALLGRSAKVQRETKIDLDASQKRLNQATREIERLNQKLDKLQSRPTHSK